MHVEPPKLALMILLAVPAVMLISCVVKLVVRGLRSHGQQDHPDIPERTGSAWRIPLGICGMFVLALILLSFVAVKTPQQAGPPHAKTRTPNLLTVPATSTVRSARTSGTWTGHPASSATVSASYPDSNAGPILLPVTPETLHDLIAASGIPIEDVLPADLLEACEVIPLSPSGLNPAPPIISYVLSPASVRKLLQPIGLRQLLLAATEYLPSKGEASPGAERADSAVAPHQLATWVETPGLGQTVVSSSFLEATTRPEDALRPAVTQALVQRINKLSEQHFGSSSNWQKAIELKLTDDALRQCTVATDTLVEVINTIDGPKKMQQTYALVEFPEDVEQEVLAEVRSALITNRTVALCIAVAAVWLMAVLTALAVRATDGASFWRRFVTGSVMAALMLPCLALSVIMVTRMSRGEATLPWVTIQQNFIVDRVEP